MKSAQSQPSNPTPVQKRSYSILTWGQLARALLEFSDVSGLSDAEPFGRASVAQSEDGTWKLELTLRSSHVSKSQLKLSSARTLRGKR